MWLLQWDDDHPNCVIKLCTEPFFFGFAQLTHRPKFSVKDAGWKKRHDRSITALVLLRAVLDPFNRIFQARSDEVFPGWGDILDVPIHVYPGRPAEKEPLPRLIRIWYKWEGIRDLRLVIRNLSVGHSSFWFHKVFRASRTSPFCSMSCTFHPSSSFITLITTLLPLSHIFNSACLPLISGTKA